MTFSKLGPLLSTFVALLTKFERYVLIAYHVFNLVPAQKCSHEDEVEEKEWPVDCDISCLETTEKASYQSSSHHFLPKLKFMQFALETLILILLTVR